MTIMYFLNDKNRNNDLITVPLPPNPPKPVKVIYMKYKNKVKCLLKDSRVP